MVQYRRIKPTAIALAKQVSRSLDAGPAYWESLPGAASRPT